jgi:Predicted membrane protein
MINGIEHDLSRFHNIPAFDATTETNTMPKAIKPKATTEETDNEETETPTPPAETPTPPATPPESPPATPPAPAATPPAAAVTDFDKGVKSERDRVMALNKLDKPATHAIVVKAIADGKQVADIAAEVIEAMDKASAQSARHIDASSLNGIPGSDAGSGDSDTFGKLITQKVKARLKNRGLRTPNRK